MTLANGQLSFNGYVLGDDIRTFMLELTGWDDLPPVTSGNTQRSMYHGSYAGSKYARERIITWTGVLNLPDTYSWAEEIAALRKATGLTDTEYPITVRTIDEELVCYGSVTARAIPNNRLFGAAGIASVSIQFTASDPRKYSTTSTMLSIGMPEVSSSGLVYPLEYPLDYGTASSTGAGSFNNVGDAPLPCIWTITGPLDNPVVYNDTTGRFIELAITLAAGESVTIDTSDGSVILNGTTDRLYTKTVASSPISLMELVPGNNALRASAASWSSGAGASVTAKDGAYF